MVGAWRSCVVFSGRKVTMDEYGSRIERRGSIRSFPLGFNCWESNGQPIAGRARTGGFCSAFRVNGGVWGSGAG